MTEKVIATIPEWNRQGQITNNHNMVTITNEVDTEIPLIRFIGITIRSDIGACPRCHRHGKVGQFCYKCCYANGVYIGTCSECNLCGVVGENCE